MTRSAALLLALLAASAAQALPITVDGKAVPGSSITVGGRVYVPVDALRTAGFRVDTGGQVVAITTGQAGGSTAVAAVQGCLGQTLFNGVWRVKFSNLRLVRDADGARWSIDLEVHNATKQTLLGLDGALVADSSHLSYIAADGTPLAWGTYDELAGQKFTFQSLPPAGLWKGTLTNIDGNAARQDRPPVKLLWLVRPAETGKSLPWNVRDPSFRIDLGCTKAGG